MTIETATPTPKLDQADVLTIVGGLLDHLVEAVAQRVMAKLTGGDGIALDNVLDAWAMNSTILEDKIGDGVQSFVDNQLDISDVVKQSLEDDCDLDDMVMTAVQNLEFSVRVSR